MTTQTQEIKNMRLISHHDLNGFGNIGEGIHLHQTQDGRRILYLAHVGPPKDITSVDVTDLANPKMMVQTELNLPHLRSNSLSIVDDTMLVAYQSEQPGLPGAGMGVYNISNPEEPKRIGWRAYSPPPMALPLSYQDTTKWNRWETEYLSGIFLAGVLLDNQQWLDQSSGSQQQVGNLKLLEGGEIRGLRVGAVGTLNFEKPWIYTIFGATNSFDKGF